MIMVLFFCCWGEEKGVEGYSIFYYLLTIYNFFFLGILLGAESTALSYWHVINDLDKREDAIGGCDVFLSKIYYLCLILFWVF